MNSAVQVADRSINLNGHQPIPEFDTYQRTADQVLELLKKENDLLAEKVKLLKKENDRDQKRRLFELYDKYYKKIMLGMSGLALAAVVASGAATYVTASQQPQDLTFPQMIALLSSSVTSSLLAGSGLVSLLIRAGYFMDCNGKFQEARRGRDAAKQALVQIEDYQRTEQLRKINRRLATLQPAKFRLRERWNIRRLIGKIAKQESKMITYVEKMNRRDRKVLEKEKDDIGGSPTHRLRNIKAKEIAKRNLEELGIGPYASFFIDPEGELPSEQLTWKQKALKNGQSIYKKVRNKIRKPPSPKILTARERLQQTCERMRQELTEGPSFAALLALTEREIARTRAQMDRLMG